MRFCGVDNRAPALQVRTGRTGGALRELPTIIALSWSQAFFWLAADASRTVLFAGPLAAALAWAL